MDRGIEKEFKKKLIQIRFSKKQEKLSEDLIDKIIDKIIDKFDTHDTTVKNNDKPRYKHTFEKSMQELKVLCDKLNNKIQNLEDEDYEKQMLQLALNNKEDYEKQMLQLALNNKIEKFSSHTILINCFLPILSKDLTLLSDLAESAKKFKTRFSENKPRYKHTFEKSMQELKVLCDKLNNKIQNLEDKDFEKQMLQLALNNKIEKFSSHTILIKSFLPILSKELTLLSDLAESAKKFEIRFSENKPFRRDLVKELIDFLETNGYPSTKYDDSPICQILNAWFGWKDPSAARKLFKETLDLLYPSDK